jgi:hypothetical protein
VIVGHVGCGRYWSNKAPNQAPATRNEVGSRLQGCGTRVESDRDAKVWHVEAKRLGDSRVSKRLDSLF